MVKSFAQQLAISRHSKQTDFFSRYALVRILFHVRELSVYWKKHLHTKILVAKGRAQPNDQCDPRVVWQDTNSISGRPSHPLLAIWHPPNRNSL